MSIRIRLFLLLACLLVAFVAVGALMQQSHRREAATILSSLAEERSGLLDRLLSLTGQSLVNFASDYSLWDEMVAFTKSEDRAWAAINIDASLPNFNAQGAWVVRVDGSPLYSVVQPAHLKLTPPPLADPVYLAQLRDKRTLHYFVESPAGLTEVRTGPILPSADTERRQPALGWFIVARVWDQAHLQRLAATLQSEVSLTAPNNRQSSTDSIQQIRPLLDWHGALLEELHVSYSSPVMRRLMEGNQDEKVLLGVFGVTVIVLVVVGVSLWVIRPLNLLTKSLSSGDSSPIVIEQRKSDEFGQLARLVTDSFAQRDVLRENEARLKDSLDLRSRLARDLHDGIIQSIYATGLGLESVRLQLSSDPGGAAHRLAACQRTLNDTLWQVRQFIDALEPESEQGHSPTQSLAALATSMQLLQPIPVVAEVDHALAAQISPQQEIHLLHMARELLSNALRHSGARQVRLELRRLPDGRAQLAISDDGRGFDPTLGPSSGRGLPNMAARARELGAELVINATLGKGARVSVTFQPKT